MKKKLTIISSVALACALFTAVGCAANSKNLASLSSNWYYDTGYRNIQPTFTEDNAQKYTYKVTHGGISSNNYYSVDFEDGTYKTEFYGRKISREDLTPITLEKWREPYIDSLGSEGYMYLYYYSAELNIPSVTFSCGGREKTFGEQTVTSECYFLSVQDYLRPVYSMRTIDRALPAEIQPTTLEQCYYEANMSLESFYSLDGNEVSTTISESGKEPYEYDVSGLNDGMNSVFDSTYLDIVMRAMRGLTSSSGLTISLYTPGLELRDYTVAFENKPLDDNADIAAAELAQLQKLLRDGGMFTEGTVDNGDGTESPKTLKTASAKVSYNGGSFSGVSQTYWFAMSGESGNETRTTMIKYSEPITYNLGKLDYVLTSIG